VKFVVSDANFVRVKILFNFVKLLLQNNQATGMQASIFGACPKPG